MKFHFISFISLSISSSLGISGSGCHNSISSSLRAKAQSTVSDHSSTSLALQDKCESFSY
jgi:hypothetical protein